MITATVWITRFSAHLYENYNRVRGPMNNKKKYYIFVNKYKRGRRVLAWRASQRNQMRPGRIKAKASMRAPPSSFISCASNAKISHQAYPLTASVHVSAIRSLGLGFGTSSLALISLSSLPFPLLMFFTAWVLSLSV